jgi:hypothetical protein
MTERQKFKVLEDFDGFELREYDPCVIAEISVADDYNGATSMAFGFLFRYISGGNQKSEKIAMTAPVISSTHETITSRQWNISFVMPAGTTLADLPVPQQSQVTLRALPAEKCLVISFKGKASTSVCESKEADLRIFAKGKGYELTSETRICRFDPPFKPGFLHYNEIVIPLAS